MRVLIAGLGYVGSTLAVELVRRGHEVFGVRRRPAAEAELSGARLLLADITSAATLERLPGDWDWVVNCVGASASGEAEYRETYIKGNTNLIDWLSRANPVKKYVYTSSTSVYGQDDGSTVDESSPTEPESATGRLLVEAEALVLRAARERGFPAVVLRVAGIYGPGRGYWFKQFMSGEARIEGEGQRILNMVHRDDVAGAIIAALEAGRPGRVYNVSDDQPVTQLDFMKHLSGAMRRPLPPTASEHNSIPRRRSATQRRISNARLKMELSYTLKYPTFREALRFGGLDWRPLPP